MTLAEETLRTLNVPKRPVIAILELQFKAYLTFLFLLKPFFQNIFHLSENTRHCLRGFRYLQGIPANAILVSLHVVELYPNMAHE